MKTVDLSRRKVDLAAILRWAEKGPVLLHSAGREFVVSKADDFDAEVQALRKSARFQAFLDRRLTDETWIPMAEVEREVADELQNHKPAPGRRSKR
jgi:hypothetical protein